MRVKRLHRDEVDINEALVRRLLTSQMPQLAELPLRLVEPSGTDNVMLRLGEDLLLRLPRIESAAAGIQKEQRIVPRIASHLRIRLPCPVGFSQPGEGYRYLRADRNWTTALLPRGLHPATG